MMREIYILALLALALGQSATGCLYTQKNSLFNDSILHYSRIGGYSFQISWETAQSHIVNASFILIGHQIETPASLLSFDAGLVNVNSAGAVFIFNPIDNYSIVYISFSIVLLKSCRGNIQLQFVDFYPILLNQSSHPKFEVVKVSLASTFAANISLYQVEAMISAFRLVSVLDSLELQVIPLPSIPNTNYQEIKVYSDTGHYNVFTRVCFTFIMFEVSSFSYYISYYSAPIYITIFTNYIAIPSYFSPPLNQKCIIGFRWMWTMPLIGAVSSNSTKIDFYEDNGVNGITYNFTSVNYMAAQTAAICFQDCQEGYVVDYSNSTYLCKLCSEFVLNCHICLSYSLCSTCVQGYYLYLPTEQCLRACPNGYYGNRTSYQCVNCAVNQFYQLINGSCSCSPGYNMVNGICMNVLGCMTAVSQLDTPTCAFCNIQLKFVLNQGRCDCITGYYLNQENCTEICGDGQLFHLQCDDGNNIDGDGCSSTCTIETSYKCVNGTSLTPSQCVYIRQNIKLSLVSIDKTDMVDQGIFTFQISPYINNFKKMNLSRDIAFQCSQQILINRTSISQEGQVVIYVNFLQDLEGQSANITIAIQRNYFSQSNIQMSIKMISDGNKLILIKNASMLQACKFIILVLAALTLAVFVFSLFAHKLIGVQLMHSLQVIYFVHQVNSSYTQTYSLLRWFTFTAFDFLYISNHWSNFQKGIVIIFAVSFLFLGLLMLFRLAIRWLASQEIKSDPQIIKPQSLMLFSKIFYNNSLFPFLMATLIVSMLFIGTKRTTSSSYLINLICVAQVLLLSLAFFYEQKAIFTGHPKKDTLMSMPHCKYEYLSIYLGFVLVVTLLVNASYLFARFPAEGLLAGVYLAFSISMVVYQPYGSTAHNVGLVINLVTVAYFLAWSALKEYGIVSQSESFQILVLVVLLALIAVSIIMTVVRTILELSLKCPKKEDSEQSNGQVDCEKGLKQRKNTRNKHEDFFRKEQDYINAIQKQNFKKYAQIQPALFNRQHPPKQNEQSFKNILKKNLKINYRKAKIKKEISDNLL